MSCLGLKNPNILPSKKAWNRFAVSLGSKFHKVRRWKPVKQAGSAFSAVLRGRRSRPPNTPFKFHARKLRHYSRNFQPVYVDELFSRTEGAHVEREKQPAEMGNAKVFENSVMYCSTTVAACSASSSSSSSSSSHVVRELNEVDLRAEMFIAKFKEEMRLQRQRSFGEYQEMLARGV